MNECGVLSHVSKITLFSVSISRRSESLLIETGGQDLGVKVMTLALIILLKAVIYFFIHLYLHQPLPP